MAMAFCCTFPSFFSANTSLRSPAVACRKASSSFSLCVVAQCRLPLSSHIVRCSKVNVDRALVESPGIDAGITESKKIAADIGTGSSLVAFYSDHHDLPLNEETNGLVDKCRETRLLLEGDPSLEDIFLSIPAPFASTEELCLVYEERYIKTMLDGVWTANELQPVGFHWSYELVTRSLSSAGGAIAAMHVVMLGLRLAAASISGYGCSSNVDGFYLVPSGVFNDVAVAASVALQSYPTICNAKRPILVIDLDVHQTTDTTKLLKDDNRVLAFNLHGPNNTPWCSNMRIRTDSGLLDCTGDHYYLAVLSDRLQTLFDYCNPSLVFFQGGVDALMEDVSRKFSMTRQGLIHRNNIVYVECSRRKIPLVITMGSGCSKPMDVSIHAQSDVYRAAALYYGTKQA